MKAIYLAALACMVSGSCFASPIEYTLTATGSGSFGKDNFTNALITVSFSGDDQNVQHWDTNYVVNFGGVTSVSVQGIGSGTIANGFVYANSANSPTSVGISDFNQGGGDTIISLLDNQLGNYQLGAISPITGTSYSRNDVAFDTTFGAFQITSLGSATFSAVSTVSAVPLPASLPMFGAAVVGLALARFGQRRKIKG